MKTALRLALAASTVLFLAACGPKQHFTQKQMESMKGHSMDMVRNSIGGPYVVTDAGSSVWWDYNGITMPDGSKEGTCQLVFVKDVVSEVRCQ